MTLNLELMCLGCETKIDTIAHINGNEIECVMSFSWDDLSSRARSDILAVLQGELNTMSAREIIGKLPQ